ncbi:LytR/AlgR family response regulator transcription factor [Foetidibacter luteolus]|uniref:LytR/AlgR family response regulator transcription factor n=1 Tax=Foetidibacter luteolus TaxID=2608880 RepID=UPI00129A9048|nr:LytTR family DNA-binding domain-containing protein [Foetidibacter luteolus]
MKIQCIVAEDEPPARELLVSYIERVDTLELKAVFSNALETFNYLQTSNPQLVFLDINMPRMNGMELIRALQVKPKIIITTAYRDYAVEGFELDVLDYLVKPVSFDRFLKSIARYNQYFLQEKITSAGDEAETAFSKAYMYFKVNKELVKIFLKDIFYIESIKDYIKIFTKEKAVVTYQRIGYMEEKLPESRFIRVHKSFIIAKDKISGYSGDIVRLEKIEIPIGRNYKQGFLKAIQ